jgi:hypothetical protein
MLLPEGGVGGRRQRCRVEWLSRDRDGVVLERGRVLAPSKVAATSGARETRPQFKLSSPGPLSTGAGSGTDNRRSIINMSIVADREKRPVASNHHSGNQDQG